MSLAVFTVKQSLLIYTPWLYTLYFFFVLDDKNHNEDIDENQFSYNIGLYQIHFPVI